MLCFQHLSKLRSDTRNKEAQLKEKEQFYENEISNNKEFEKKISLTERAVVKVKQEYQDLEKERDRFYNEVFSVYLVSIFGRETHQTIFSSKSLSFWSLSSLACGLIT